MMVKRRKWRSIPNLRGLLLDGSNYDLCIGMILSMAFEPILLDSQGYHSLLLLLISVSDEMQLRPNGLRKRYLVMSQRHDPKLQREKSE
jgi:hypothetical protein